MDYKVLLETYEKMYNNSQKEFNQFINEVTKWWSGKLKKHYRVKPALSSDMIDKDAMTRYNLYYEILELNLKCVFRDDSMSNIDFEVIQEKILYLWKLQSERAINPRRYPHPSLWFEYAKAALRNHNLELAEKLFRASLNYIELDKEQKGLYYLIDKVKIMGEYIRCLYLLNDYNEAKRYLDEIEIIATKIDSQQELETVKKRGAIPFDYFPTKLYVYFVKMDFLINSPEWDSNPLFKKRFLYYRRKSMLEFNTPKYWHILIKLIICTDMNWLLRDGLYVKKIAEELYVTMGNNIGFKLLRRARIMTIGLFKNSNFGKVAAILCIVSFLLSQPLDATEINKDEFVEIITNECQDLASDVKLNGINYITESIEEEVISPISMIDKYFSDFKIEDQSAGIYALSAADVGTLDIIDM